MAKGGNSSRAVLNRLEKLSLHQAALDRLLKDLEKKEPADPVEMEWLVKRYYECQEDRIRQNNRLRQLRERGLDSASLDWLAEQAQLLEEMVKKVIEVHVQRIPLCRWAMSITGIGSVLAAGVYAHVHPHVTPYAGGVWRYFGLDPSQNWGKGEKRPWNADAKLLAWKIGQAFVKNSSRDSLYSRIYKTRKEKEWRRNIAGEFKQQALANAERVGSSTEAYKWNVGRYVIESGPEFESWVDSGMKAVEVPKREVKEGGLPMLSPLHIQRRAERYVVKLFLSHAHAVGYFLIYGEAPPLPYIVTHGEHHSVILPPNLDKFEELSGFENSFWQKAENTMKQVRVQNV